MNAPHRNWPAIAAPPAHFIGGQWASPSSGATLSMVDPSDGSPFADIARGDANDIDAAVRAAMSARDGPWGKLAAVDRGRLLARLSRAIGDHADELTLIEARDC